MATWNDRTLPYPLLAPWTDDYVNAEFTASVPSAILQNGKHINLTVKFNLTSPALRELVQIDSAEYVALITCSRTFSRETYRADQDDEAVVFLESGDYDEELELTPYVVAMQEIKGFLAPEHAEEFRIPISPKGSTFLLLQYLLLEIPLASLWKMEAALSRSLIWHVMIELRKELS